MKLSLTKNILAAFALIVTAFAAASCEREVLRGHGEEVTRMRTVGSFTEIDAGGQFEIYLTQGPEEDIRLVGQENVLADVRTTTRNNELEIEFMSRRVKINKPVKVYITMPELTSVAISGSNTVHGLTDWHVRDLNLKTSGSGKMYFNLHGANAVETQISGSGEISLGGEAYSHTLDISGSGRLQAFDLETQRTDIHISGSGKSDIRAMEALKANISGSGTVRYKGNPAISTNISGSGKVQNWN